MSGFTDKLSACLAEGKLYTGEPMARHTTFRAGGPADWYVEPADETELAAVLKLCREEEVPYYILGNGSNLLVSDDGYRGVIVAIDHFWSDIKIDGCTILAGAGAILSTVARQAMKAGLTGMEGLSGIPGTIGGAVVMNAGAYGAEIRDVLRRVTVMTPDGEIRKLLADTLELGYRTSCIARLGYIVLYAELELAAGDPEVIRARMEELSVQRRAKQPLEYPSAGSTFKRPEGYFAGKLIQDAGLRGYQVGGAQVSEKHCGFVINRDQASASDIMALCREVQKIVKEQSGVDLEMEVRLLGNF
jgi:UDP-N-acetylmuramate dehydrogenase